MTFTLLIILSKDATVKEVVATGATGIFSTALVRANISPQVKLSSSVSGLKK
jgi:hypothetical protein